MVRLTPKREQRVFSSTKTQTVEAAVSIRLVEASTGLIIYSDEAKGYAETSSKQTMGIGGTAGYDATGDNQVTPFNLGYTESGNYVVRIDFNTMKVTLTKAN
jgi:curli biogenesis system outer membrane secretion channel CsgG